MTHWLLILNGNFFYEISYYAHEIDNFGQMWRSIKILYKASRLINSYFVLHLMMYIVWSQIGEILVKREQLYNIKL